MNNSALSTKRSIIASFMGNIIEWYDFVLFGFLAPLIAELFFPSSNKIVSLLAAFSVYALGFLTRPLGAIIFGHLGDRWGRAKTLKLSIVLISLPAIGMSLLPTYQQIGIVAPLLMIALRLAQGLCIGGEFAGAMIYLYELAPSNQRARYSCCANLGSNLGSIIATTIAGLIAFILTHEQLITYGWRICFMISGLIGIIGLWLRGNIVESSTFLANQKQMNAKFLPIKEVVQKHLKHVILLCLIILMCASADYTVFLYLSTYLYTFLHYPLDKSMQLLVVLTLISICITPFFAYLADRYGYRKIMIIAGIIILLFTIPSYYWLTKTLSWYSMLPLTIGYSAEQGSLAALLVTLFPGRARYTGISLAYNITMAIIGGTCALFNTWIISYFNNPLMVCAHLMICTTITLFALIVLVPKFYPRNIS